MLLRIVDAIAETGGRLAAWMFFAIGVFVTYEVVMRHFFTMPTIWVDEVSRVMQVWATYLAGAYILKHREMIVIEVAFRDPASPARRIAESFALVVIALFCAVASWFGFGQWLEKTLIGDHTDSLLGIPKWITLSSIWVGFGLLGLQCLAELWRLWREGVREGPNVPEAD